MLLIYYNVTHGYFYLKKVSFYCDHEGREYEVGYTNQFGHFIVQAFVYTDDYLKSVKSYSDYRYSLNKINKISHKDKIINRAIDLLNKLK